MCADTASLSTRLSFELTCQRSLDMQGSATPRWTPRTICDAQAGLSELWLAEHVQYVEMSI